VDAISACTAAAQHSVPAGHCSGHAAMISGVPGPTTRRLSEPPTIDEAIASWPMTSGRARRHLQGLTFPPATVPSKLPGVTPRPSNMMAIGRRCGPRPRRNRTDGPSMTSFEPDEVMDTEEKFAGTGIGAPMRRLEDRRFVTGKGDFVDDLALSSMAFAQWCGHLMAMPRSSRSSRRRPLPPLACCAFERPGQNWC
jgi:hypothetical protein